MFITPAPPHSPNIRRVKVSEAAIVVDIMEKDDFKKQIEAWRWQGEDSGAAWGLEVQLMVSLQNIDILEDKFEVLKKGINNQTVEISYNRRVMNNLMEGNKN